MKRLAAALVAIFALSACAVTGQPARPGTAAIYDGATITTSQVSAWGNAESAMTGQQYDPGTILTLLLLRPVLDKQASAQGIVFGDDEIVADAQKWMTAYHREVVAPTQDMIDLVRTVRLFFEVVKSTDDIEVLRTAVNAIEADSTVSPLYGAFTSAQFGATITAQGQLLDPATSPLGDVVYLELAKVSGFDATAKRDWMVDAGLPSSAPSASPTQSSAPTP